MIFQQQPIWEWKRLEKVKQNFYWPGMRQYVKEYTRTCDKCAARNRNVSKKNRAPLGTYNVGAQMEPVAIDILGPLPKTHQGNKYCLVLTDCFTKWTEAFAIPDQEALTIPKTLVNKYVCRFGTPLQIHSDQGTHFGSRVFQQMCDLLCIDKTGTSFHPQSNGCVERFNRTLTNTLSMYCATDQHHWDENLPQVILAYRSSVHATTGFTQNFLMFGREITLPLQAVIGRPELSEGQLPSIEDYVAELQQNLKMAHKLARENLKKNTQYQKRQYDIKSKKRIIDVGRPFWLHDLPRKVGACHKLCAKWNSPYVVTRRIDDTIYLMKKSAK